MSTRRIRAALIPLLAVLAAACGGSTGDDAEAPATSRAAPTTVEQEAPAPTDRTLQAFREDFAAGLSSTSWYPRIVEIESISAGWVYITTDLHSDNPDDEEPARSICSAAIATGLQMDEPPDPFRGVSVFGVRSAKVQECEPFQPIN